MISPIDPSNWLILVRLLTAHLITEWLFQLPFWKSNNSDIKFFSIKNFFQGTIAGIISYIFAASWGFGWLIFIIFIFRVVLNGWKCKKEKEEKGPLILFSIARQVIYLSAIAVSWLLLPEVNIKEVNETLCLLFNNKIWITLLAYLTVIFPTGSFIGKLAVPWHQELWQSHLEKIKKNSGTAGTQEADTKKTLPQEEEPFLKSLANSGKWIGRLERILILTFILINKYEAIGFLITAKIIRFTGMKDVSDKKEAEYVLIGTMWSFVIAIIVGIFTNWLLKQVTNP